MSSTDRWSDAAESPVDDENLVVSAEYQDDADEVIDGHVEESDVAEKKPKKSNKLLILVVMGLVMLTLVGFMGAKIFGAMRPKPAPVEQDMMVSAAPSGEGAQSSSLLEGAPQTQAPEAAASIPADHPAPANPVPDASMLSAQPPAQAPVVAAPAAAPAVSNPPVAQAAAPAAIQPSGAPAAPGAATAEIRAVAHRMDALEQSIARVAQDLDALRAERAAAPKVKSPRPVASAKPAPPKAPTKSAAAAVPADSAQEPARSAAPQPAAESKSAAVAVASAGDGDAAKRQDSKSDPSLSTLRLRAVYPPTGADMQAWVTEGDTVRVVNKGSVIAGARVLSISPDRIVTDRGEIRN